MYVVSPQTWFLLYFSLMMVFLMMFANINLISLPSQSKILKNPYYHLPWKW